MTSTPLEQKTNQSYISILYINYKMSIIKVKLARVT